MTRHLAPTPGQPDRAATHRAEVDTYRATAVLRAQIAAGSEAAQHAADGMLAFGSITALDPPMPTVARPSLLAQRWPLYLFTVACGLCLIVGMSVWAAPR